MKYSLITLLLLLPLNVNFKEACDLNTIGLNEQSSEITKLFYTGTCHYRNEDYKFAVISWEKVAKLSPLSPEDEGLKIDILNNLGYMKFFGFGTPKAQTVALDYWKQAILLGHDEAEYHLCHAYADESQSTYHLAKARKHCKKALLIYRGKTEKDEEILTIIEKYLKRIN